MEAAPSTTTRTPLLRRARRTARRLLNSIVYPDSRAYWETRYAAGGTSGNGSYGALAAFKAEVINGVVARKGIRRVIEFGCGDGAQLALARYPSYVGLDVSRTAITLCRARFADDRSKSFFLYDPESFVDRLGIFTGDLTLSLDVIYHLTEDEVFERYMEHLFAASRRYVVIYSSNMNRPALARHVKHRRFTDWIEARRSDFRLLCHIPNRYPITQADGSFADFYIYRRRRLHDDAPTAGTASNGGVRA